MIYEVTLPKKNNSVLGKNKVTNKRIAIQINIPILYKG